MARPKRHRAPSARVIITPAEAGSINSIIRANTRSRLYVSPIAWTDQHVQLLGCTFTCVMFPFGQVVVIDDSDDDSEDQDSSVTLAGAAITTMNWLTVPQSTRWLIVSLRGSVNYNFQRLVIKGLLYANRLHQMQGNAMRFYFGGKRVSSVHVNNLFSRGQTDPRPVLATVRLDQVRPYRRGYVHLNPSRSSSVTNAALKRLKTKKLLPPIELEDPYLLACLISIAQSHRLIAAATPEYSHVGPSIRVHLLVSTSLLRLRSLYLYTADIEQGFLDRFEEPFVFSPGKSPVVFYHPIPLADADDAATHLYRLLRAD